MARKKKENVNGVRKETPTHLIVNEIVNVSHDRNRKDVGTLKNAIQHAESVVIPNRYRLIDLYHDMLSLDGHLGGIVEKRTKAVTNKKVIFKDKKGIKIDHLDELINSKEFERFVEIMDEEPEVDEGYVTLVNAKLDENGEIVELHCPYDPESRGGNRAQSR